MDFIQNKGCIKTLNMLKWSVRFLWLDVFDGKLLFQEDVYLNRKKPANKITRYRRYSFFNIGTLLFGTIFIYMVISVFMYATETHVTAYEVKKGTITGNYRYHALALHEELVVNAPQSGSLRYLVREGVKTSAGGAVCAITEGSTAEAASINDFTMDTEDAKRMLNTMSGFTINYSGSAFQKTYDLKSGIEGIISEIIEENSDSYVSSRNQICAPESGFAVYSIDQFETVTEADLTSSMFNQSSYSAEDLRGRKSVKAGEPVFKLITSESWALYFPLDDKLMTELADTQKLRFRFLKDNVTFSAPFSIVSNGEEAYGKITMDSSIVRYASDRFLEIELVMNKKSGLKIPTSSIVERSFYRVPEEYVIENTDTNQEVALKIERFGEDGSSKISYLTANVYDYEDGDYLIDQQLLEDSDYILMDNSSKKMQLQEKDLKVLHGVYNINKGYAVFREITVIDENEEYCIVESNNIYGLAAYDYIVLNASEVTEDQIVY